MKRFLLALGIMVTSGIFASESLLPRRNRSQATEGKESNREGERIDSKMTHAQCTEKSIRDDQEREYQESRTAYKQEQEKIRRDNEEALVGCPICIYSDQDLYSSYADDGNYSCCISLLNWLLAKGKQE